MGQQPVTDTGSDGGSTGGTGGGTGGDTGGGAAQSNSLFPASIDESSTRTLSVARTLNGISLSDDRFGGREGSLPAADADGDGQTDYVFLATAGLLSDCAAGVLLASGTLSRARWSPLILTPPCALPTEPAIPVWMYPQFPSS